MLEMCFLKTLDKRCLPICIGGCKALMEPGFQKMALQANGLSLQIMREGSYHQQILFLPSMQTIQTTNTGSKMKKSRNQTKIFCLKLKFPASISKIIGIKIIGLRTYSMRSKTPHKFVLSQKS